MKEDQDNSPDKGDEVIPISGLYQNWFLDYASYVILERAVPYLEDGLKPVQRRILHALKQMDDGRFHKVANVIGQTMQYHPHGDASIGDALVKLGQKDLMIDTQGNWGDNRTGDKAAAARYIEARLSKFALEVAFNPQTTEWQVSYDGRKKEPVHLPMKFPLLLFQGVEGIAVGLATKILPHNFIELCQASIKNLKGKKVKILPDFPTGGRADFSQYNDGKRGGKVKIRVTIEEVDKKTLAIRDLPYGVTTNTLIDSIVKASDKGKIKIKKIIDNTAKEVEILIELPSGVSPDMTRDALYAFTDCELSISPNCCVIVGKRPEFIGVSDMLMRCTEMTKELLRRELEIKLGELQEKWHMSSLEKIFIENRIYRDIEECETWEAVIETIDRGLDPFKKLLFREVTREDIIRLTEIKIKRISKYDAFKADEYINKLEAQQKETQHHLDNLTEYAIDFYQGLIDRYGKGRERKTKIIESFADIKRTQVAVANTKIYMSAKEGFVGSGLKKEEFIAECSDLDSIIAFRKDGRFMVSKVSDKIFMGKNIIHAAVWKKGDERTIYNMIYSDPGSNKNYVKRFSVTGVSRDKEYDLTKGAAKAKVQYFSANPNGESELINIQLSPACRAKIKNFDYDFADLAIKGRASKGNVLTRWPIRKVSRKALGESSLGGMDLWVDMISGALKKTDPGDNGLHLGSFDTGDHILVLYTDGHYKLTDFELSNRYQMDQVEEIVKWDETDVISCVYYHGGKKKYYVKRFLIETTTLDTKYLFISEESGSKLDLATTMENPVIEFTYTKGKGGGKKREKDILRVSTFIEVKGWKSLGNRLSNFNITKIEMKEEIE